MTADLWIIASGATLYAGCNPPPAGAAWLPASGTMGRVSLNQMTSVADTTNPDAFLNDSNLGYVLDAWCSSVYCKDYGLYGSIVFSGGGHRDRLSNATYRYDLYTRLFSRISNGTPIPIRFHDYDTVCAGSQVYLPDAPTIANPWGELWTDDTRSAIIVGKCPSTHTYGNFAYVPGAAAGNTNGLVLIMGFTAGAHSIDLDNPSAGWSRCGGLYSDGWAPTQLPAYGATLWDGTRARLVIYPSHNTTQSQALTLSFPSRTMGTITGYMDSYYGIARHMVTDDLYLCIDMRLQTNTYPILRVHDPLTLLITSAPQSGTAPPQLYTLEWDDAHRRLLGWTGTDKTLWICTPPTDPRTGTWVWTSQVFTNPDPVVQQTGPNLMYNRLHYVAALDAFFAVTRVDGPVQSWKF